MKGTPSDIQNIQFFRAIPESHQAEGHNM